MKRGRILWCTLLTLMLAPLPLLLPLCRMLLLPLAVLQGGELACLT